MFDIMVKAVNTPHTRNERLAARLKASNENVNNPTKVKHREIQAALEVGVRSKKQTYAYAATQGIKVTHLLLSTGGTLYKTTYY